PEERVAQDRPQRWDWDGDAALGGRGRRRRGARGRRRVHVGGDLVEELGGEPLLDLGAAAAQVVDRERVREEAEEEPRGLVAARESTCDRRRDAGDVALTLLAPLRAEGLPRGRLRDVVVRAGAHRVDVEAP